MKRFFFICILLSFYFTGIAQNVTNSDFYQDGNRVVITYDLDKSAEISVFVSTDGGLTFSSALKAVSGAVGKNVQAGYGKTIIWDVLSERDKIVGENIVFKIKASGGVQEFTVNGVTFEMIEVEGGTFTMGATSEQGSDVDSDERPAHSVTLSTFYIGKYEVTQRLWKAVMGSNPSYFTGDDNLPIENVSWNDCQTFIKKLNSLTGKKFALPTEAQWEYAARGGQKSKGYKYSGSYEIGDVAWYNSNSSSKTHRVGSKQPNELGIYDMSGNVWEWCSDWYGSYSSSSQTNPTGPTSGSLRVLRGGSWNYGAGNCRVSNRGSNSPDYRYSDCGFRLVFLP